MQTSLSKSEQIRQILVNNPKAPAKEISEQVGCNINMVYQTRYGMNKKKAKNGKPTLKAPKKGTLIRADVASSVYRKLQLECALYKDTNTFLSREVERLESEIVGFRAVISYLEHRLGMESSQ